LKTVDTASLLHALDAGEVDPDIRNFNYVVRALGAQGQFDEAVAVVGRMTAAGVAPNEGTYNALIAACAEQRNPAAAWEVAAVMQERGDNTKLIALGTRCCPVYACVGYYGQCTGGACSHRAGFPAPDFVVSRKGRFGGHRGDIRVTDAGLHPSRRPRVGVQGA
jgi:pentatricopeptide repeat protein